MKALVKSEAKPGIWLEDVPIPSIQDHEVLIRVKKTAICGTDVHIDLWDAWAQKNVPVPLVIGHEFVGEVAKVGAAVRGIREGDRVTGEGHITCGECRNCREGKRHLCPKTRGIGYHVYGCFAEYFPLPAENVFPLPGWVSDDLAAIFDPYGNAVHTALSFEMPGEDVLITGAGPIGLMATGICRQAGARNIVVTDPNSYRLDLAKKMGATCVFDPTKVSFESIMQAERIDGFTVGLEMAGHPSAIRNQLENAAHGARIALLGILPPDTMIDWDLIIFKMLQIKGIYGREIFRTWYQMLHLLEGGLDLQSIITHRFPYHQFREGLNIMQSGKCGKVLLDWT